MEPPDDLREFWSAAVDEAQQAPLDYYRTIDAHHEEPDHRIDLFYFRGIDGNRLLGWIASPLEREGKCPAFLWTAPYGQESVLPNQFGTRPGLVSLSFNFFGHDAFYREAYVPARGYFADGAESPETWVYKRMFQNAYLAVRVLRSLLDVDEERIAACGLSQGAGISLWLGAWCPYIRAVCADLPFLSTYAANWRRISYRYPPKELADFADLIPMGDERVSYTLSYYDTAFQAAHCQVPTLVSAAAKDPAVRPEQVEAVYAALPGQKRLVHYPGGHDWDVGMVDANAHWLKTHL